SRASGGVASWPPARRRRSRSIRGSDTASPRGAWDGFPDPSCMSRPVSDGSGNPSDATFPQCPVLPADLDSLLKQTLADHPAQSAEKKAFVDWAARHAPDEASRAVARSRAFSLARAELPGEPARVLDWLEETIKVFSRPAGGPTPLPPEPSGAYFSP